MAKKNSIKSTAKKKSKSTKKDEIKKTSKKATVASKTKSATKTTGKAKTAGKAKKKMVSLKELILKKFDIWEPAEIFKAVIDEEYLKNFASPPIVSGLSDEENKRIKELLLKKRDMVTIRAEIKKETAEKAAAEKAAAEKAAVERIAAKKAAKKREAAKKATTRNIIIGLVSGFILVIALILNTSFSNKSKYYIKENNGALEIWQGRFAPMGEAQMMILPETQLSEQMKAVYSENEVSSIIFNYYIDKADAISGISDIPDYMAIKAYLNKALLFATTSDLRKKVYTRLNNIKFNNLMYKAGVSVNRGTISDLDEAMKYLNMALLLRVDAGKSDEVKQKIKAIEEQSAEIKAKMAEE